MDGKGELLVEVKSGSEGGGQDLLFFLICPRLRSKAYKVGRGD